MSTPDIFVLIGLCMLVFFWPLGLLLIFFGILLAFCEGVHDIFSNFWGGRKKGVDSGVDMIDGHPLTGAGRKNRT